MKILVKHNSFYSQKKAEVCVEIPKKDIFPACEIENESVISAQIVMQPTKPEYKIPSQNIYIKDVLGISHNMVPNNIYNCILEISSFIIIQPPSECNCSIKGIYREVVPPKYKPSCVLYSKQSCIEVDGDIFLIAPYNNLLCKTNDGELVEVVPQAYYNLKAELYYLTF